MSRHNRPAQTPPKAPEPKAADAPAPIASPADDDLHAQIAAQMASAEGAASDVATETPSVPADASLDGDDAEDGGAAASAPDVPSEPPAPGKLVTIHVSPDVDPALVEAFDAPPKAPEPKAVRFKVWQHGSLQCDSVTYLPGEALPFSAARVAALGISHLAVPVED